jgi:hypothetical protein
MSTPKFEFNAVWNQRLEESGKISVVYINGIRTREESYKKNIQGFDGIWNLYGNLIAPAKQAQKDTLLKYFDPISKGAINLDVQYRNTSDSTGNDWADIGVFVVKFLVGDILEQLQGQLKDFPFDVAEGKVNEYNNLKKKIDLLENSGEDVTDSKKS